MEKFFDFRFFHCLMIIIIHIISIESFAFGVAHEYHVKSNFFGTKNSEKLKNELIQYC